jgi:hypothetical protein
MLIQPKHLPPTSNGLAHVTIVSVNTSATQNDIAPWPMLSLTHSCSGHWFLHWSSVILILQTSSIDLFFVESGNA